jgi:mRNA-degrading endonuclease RelE of RelBE toxin-antitoxin system
MNIADQKSSFVQPSQVIGNLFSRFFFSHKNNDLLFYSFYAIINYMKEIIWNPKALKQLKKIPAHDKLNIINAVDALAVGMVHQDIKLLKNHDYGYRLRVGRYRVLFGQNNHIVDIYEVKKRDESTY